jgi:glutaredoxin
VTSVRAHHTVTVYTRHGCHLCDEAIAVVRQVADGRAEVQLIDIDADPALTEQYTIRVPVVAVDGVEIAQYQIVPEQLEVVLDG